MSLTVSTSLVLGTVQLGLPYGIANKIGQPSQDVAADVVRTAWASGIREFDTAQDYGTSEEILGKAFAQLGVSSQAKVISKIDPQIDHGNPQAMAKAIEGSLKRLGMPCLWGLMIHKEEFLSQWPKGMGKILRDFVTAGKVKHIGVSVYSPDRALEALNMEGIDMIQAPSNILDRRFEKKKFFEQAAQRKKQVYIRSVFLQGLILMEPDALSGDMLFARPVLEKITALARELKVTRNELALGYLKERIPGAKLLIGAQMPEQILENLLAWEKEPAANLVSLVLEHFDQVDEKILNPILWRR